MPERNVESRARTSAFTALRGSSRYASVAADHAYRSSTLEPELAASQRPGLRDRTQQSWDEALANLDAWDSSAARTPAVPEPTQPTLFLGWHFPELPTALSWFTTHDVLLVTGEEAPWFATPAQAGQVAVVSTRAGLRTLSHALRQNRSIATMIDHSLPDTGAVEYAFLGHIRRMSTGLLSSAHSHGYRIVLLGPRDGQVTEVATLSAGFAPAPTQADQERLGRGSAALAQQVNELLEAEVRRAPERWLLWWQLTPAASRSTPGPVK